MNEDGRELKAALGPTSACPPIEQLGQYADAVLPGSERSALESHILRCSNCQSELALLRQFTDVAVRPEEERSIAWITAKLQSRAQEIYAPVSATRTARTPWWRVIFTPPALSRAALVVGCLFIVISGSLYLRRGSAPVLNTVLDSGSEVVRSNAVPLISPKGDLTMRPDSLQWQAVPGAARYQVSIMEVDRTELWKTEATAVSVEIPGAVRARIQPAKSLLWQVIALDAAGKRLGASDLEKFRLVPDVPQKTP